MIHVLTRTLLCNPIIPDIPRASWKEWIWNLFRSTTCLNSFWILSRTSSLTPRVSTRFVFESWSANRARLDVICPQVEKELLQWGVPRNTTRRVRLMMAWDRRRARRWHQRATNLDLMMRRRRTSLRMIPPKLWATKMYGASFFISLSSFTPRSRPCCETLFLLFAWKRPPMTSALYP